MEIFSKSEWLEGFQKYLKPEGVRYNSVVGLSGRNWLYPAEICNAGDWVLVESDQKGMSGNAVSVKMVDGSYRSVIGPWHTTPEALLEDCPGIDLRFKRLTQGVIFTYIQDWSLRMAPMRDVGYLDRGPVIWDMTGSGLWVKAQTLADNLGHSVYLHTQTVSGWSSIWVNPSNSRIRVLPPRMRERSA